MMKTNTIVEGIKPVATSPISLKSQAREFNVRDFGFWTEQDCPNGKVPNHRIKLKSNCEKKRFWAQQTHKKTEDESAVTERTDLDVNTNFVIDYLPLCCDEDWEMMAYSLAKDQPNQIS